MLKTNSLKNFLTAHRLKLALAALVISTVASIPSFDAELTILAEKAIEVTVMIGLSELLFIAGIALMALSQQNKFLTKKIFSKSYIKNEILAKPINMNFLFRAGLAFNSIGALGTGLALGYGAVTALPAPMILSVLALAGFDIVTTIVIRYNIYKGIGAQSY